MALVLPSSASASRCRYHGDEWAPSYPNIHRYETRKVSCYVGRFIVYAIRKHYKEYGLFPHRIRLRGGNWKYHGGLFLCRYRRYRSTDGYTLRKKATCVRSAHHRRRVVARWYD